MSSRRSFLTRLTLVFSAVTAFAQKGILENGKAKVCADDAVKCPNNHMTCKSIDAPIVVGNDAWQNPDFAQLRDFHLMRCEVCHVLFTRE